MPASKRLLTVALTLCVLPPALTACGGGGGGGHSASAPTPAAAVSSGAASAPSSSGTPRTGGTAAATNAPGGGAAPASSRAARQGTRCHTSELRASVGREDRGAGQENFPVVLTNTSARTCTLHGFPGAAFVDAAGQQLGPDPHRAAGSSPTTVTLAPGASAWAGLTFSNPEISGAATGTPASLLVTPPDERDPLTVPWTAGAVPVGGNASEVSLMPFRAGDGT
ncbi:DUF4232 domain-containing protein [Streptomyces sp. MS06]|uniref:DUF4232 domain-containing protein n=1 Tax=Streptomyces sp. MS06 TaxID=3385974 RepID=UPI0039A20ACA